MTGESTILQHTNRTTCPVAKPAANPSEYKDDLQRNNRFDIEDHKVGGDNPIIIPIPATNDISSHATILQRETLAD